VIDALGRIGSALVVSLSPDVETLRRGHSARNSSMRARNSGQAGSVALSR
jgi:hypothetical protein